MDEEVRRRITELEARLAAAEARIRSLESRNRPLGPGIRHMEQPLKPRFLREDGQEVVGMG